MNSGNHWLIENRSQKQALFSTFLDVFPLAFFVRKMCETENNKKHL